MAWSKTATSSIGFEFGGYASYNESKLDECKVVLGEWVSWLVTRGWVLEQSSTNASGSGTVYWKITKAFVTSSGSNKRYSWWVEYIGLESAPDELNIYGWDRTGDRKQNAGVVTLGYAGEELHGVWTMWASDQDTDSFLIINQTNGYVIGFMPPSGSLIPYGAFGNYYTTRSGVLPLYAKEPAYIENVERPLSTGWGLEGSTSGLQSSVPYKFDYVIGRVNGQSLFTVNGGDMSSLLNLNSGGLVQGDGFASPINTLLLDGEYYMAWGEKSQLLFNVGANPPVY